MISTAPAPNGGFEHRPSISLVGIQTGWGEAASIDFDYNEKRISVSLVSSDTSGSRKTGYHGALTEDQLINKLTQSMASKEFDEDANYEAMVDGNHTVTQVAAPRRILNFRSEFQIDNNLPQYSSEDMIVSEALIEHGKVTKVVINGQDMLCKAEENGIETTSLSREISSLQTIRNANSGSIRVPKLLGYVKHSFDGSIIGFLGEWIPNSSFGQNLKDIKVDEVPRELRERWAIQIRQSLDELHRIGVFWGDEKPSNIIIDNNNNLLAD
ncbi:hypothetical protein TWF102_006637 [Orbilia oligospora]|uniref:Protein kinase domain-containing protein n=1 Tax=Orbilia oligospora TaxID=2813651 RepID=A0A7C8NPR5_ORBOL|nr:hypothetical protein TWF706_008806 [Orbilia oligospora]KAF3096361.1 hypothetical protein TWF102_006637 [Orbilia oligospora]KAF3118363.1 hypothetical protein TWF103_000368 [Orbilia oligospora]KAF3140608.1 hypothetical protein TWF703_002813 [Orbilia oligospora]